MKNKTCSIIFLILLAVSWQTAAEEAVNDTEENEDEKPQDSDDTELKQQPDESQDLTIGNGGHGLILKKSSAFDHRRFRRIGALVAFSIGGAAGISALITGIMAIKKQESLVEDCLEKRCPEQRWRTLDTSRKLATATDILIGVGAAGVAAGMVFLFIRPERKFGKKKVKISPVAGMSFSGAVITGEF